VARHRWDPVAPWVRVVHPRRVGDDLTPGRARGPGWVRTGSSLYVPSSRDPVLVQQRIVEVAARLPSYAVVTGWAACLLHGAAWCDGLAVDGRTPLPVLVCVGPRGGTRRHDGIAVTFERIPEWETTVRYGIRVARPERAVVDEMRRHDEREALVVLESALAGRITSVERFGRFAAAHRGMRRSDAVRWALPRARGGVRSPMEVRVRTVAEEDAGWPRLLVNRVVLRADGTRIGEVDLVDEQAPAAIEVDGADHREAERQAWDITKEEALRDVGFEVARVTGRQALDPAVLAPRLVAVRRRALARPPAERRWRLEADDGDLETWLADRESRAMFYENLPERADDAG
jgi:very-short-patch-repair endonuclease